MTLCATVGADFGLGTSREVRGLLKKEGMASSKKVGEREERVRSRVASRRLSDLLLVFCRHTFCLFICPAARRSTLRGCYPTFTCLA